VIDLVAACLWLDLSTARKLVLLSLCENADEEGYCFPSQAYIAFRASLSERAVRDHLHGLETDGYLSTLQLGRGRVGATERLLDIDRIYAEAQARKAVFDEHRRPRRQPAVFAGSTSVQPANGAVQPANGAVQPEAHVCVTVREPSEEPSDPPAAGLARARATPLFQQFAQFGSVYQGIPEDIDEAVEEYGEEWVARAIAVARRGKSGSDKPPWGYVLKILMRWKAEGRPDDDRPGELEGRQAQPNGAGWRPPRRQDPSANAVERAKQRFGI
jgi:hypothetical protein